jgi:hypothetical protein
MSEMRQLEFRGLDLVPGSLVSVDGSLWGLARTPGGKVLVVSGPPALASWRADVEGEAETQADCLVLVGRLSGHNAAALRKHLPWLAPRPLGLRTSAGLGDRLGVATPGQIRALRATGGTIAPVLAQQSIREMSRTGRTPQQVVDDAVWGAFASGWTEGLGADGDHLKTEADIDACLGAGCTLFTFDPGAEVDERADRLAPGDLSAAFAALPWPALEDTARDLERRYLAGSWDIEGRPVAFGRHALAVAAVKYGRALVAVSRLFRHLEAAAAGRPFEVEISVDETDAPTSPVEHLYVASELKRLGVAWVSLAPRFVGRFEKGVDYLGDLGQFASDFATHAAIARTLGPYKLSLHSGSDKFSIYEIAARETRGLVHLKTAGTSYLEALRTIARAVPPLFREIYAFARGRYEDDRATYHVSASLERAPDAGRMPDADLAGLLDDFHARQVLHVTFGSVLSARSADGTWLFRDRLMSALGAHEDLLAATLEAHFVRHLRPFAEMSTP